MTSSNECRSRPEAKLRRDTARAGDDPRRISCRFGTADALFIRTTKYSYDLSLV